ncbi:MAG: hypothetical protein ACREQA_15320 [Candidatus Binatia bacterium]
MLVVGELEATARLEAGRQAPLEGSGDRIDGTLQERAVGCHVGAVVGLLIEEVAEIFVGGGLSSRELAEDLEDLLGLAKP